MPPAQQLLLSAAPLAQLCLALGAAAYAGPMLAFAVLINARGRIPNLPTAAVVRVARAWGPGFGIALGAAVFGALTLHYGERGRFAWGPSAGGDVRELACWSAGLLLWISNIQLEVWTLEPLRKLDPGPALPSGPAYEAAADRWGRHMAVQAALCVLVLALVALG